jgi:hypothetical protein
MGVALNRPVVTDILTLGRYPVYSHDWGLGALPTIRSWSDAMLDVCSLDLLPPMVPGQIDADVDEGVEQLTLVDQCVVGQT